MAPAPVEVLDDILVDIDRFNGDLVPLSELGPTPVDPVVVKTLRLLVAQRHRQSPRRSRR